jgi:large subunit ribosomal protein L34
MISKIKGKPPIFVNKVGKKCELTLLIFLAKINNMSITYQPKKRKRKKVHGFLKRKRTKGGRRVLRKRMKKGRWKLTV